MSALFELTIVRKKLVIKPLREITIHDLVPVRETLNSIDFILGDDDSWDYKQFAKECWATTKFRLHYAEEILKFIRDNEDKLKVNSIDNAFLSDLTKVYKITRAGKSEQDIKKLDLDKIVLGNKNRVINKITETINDINELAKTMGDIL